MNFSFFFVVDYESQGEVADVCKHLDCLGFAYGLGQIF